MANELVIVESPAKASTINKYLGKNTKVMASIGHIRDLPKSTLAVDVENDFEPKYINIRGKGDLIKELKKEAKKAKKIYIATDPDREGEAIAWHLAFILSEYKDKITRVTFNEITKDAIIEAMKHPRDINQDIVDAQQARRVLDRIVGYKMSPLLWKKVKSGLSAGRVQSVALKMINDKENEINAFNPEEYWNINAIIKNGKDEIESKFYGNDQGAIEIKNKQQADDILNDLKKGEFIVKQINKGQKKKSPAPPFTTSTMQQEANKKLNFSLKKTMGTAQGLYEGLNIPGIGTTGLITYMRTDSTRIADVAKKIAKEEIEKKYGQNYHKDRVFKVSKDAQDGHEAIRPVHIELAPESIKKYLTLDQYKLYNLVYKRFMMSQMEDAIYETNQIIIENGRYIFKVNNQVLKFDGYLVLDDSKENNHKKLKFEVGQKVETNDIIAKQSFTQPPARYTEASLVKALEENDIGRPSTYSPTITTLLNRYYVKKEQKTLVPTQLGEVVNKLVIENFHDIINESFTANLEMQMDEIAQGHLYWKELLHEFYPPFEKEVLRVEKDLEHVELTYEQSDIKCEKCGRNMVYKYGRYGKFLACPGFPECKNAKPIIDYIDVPCPNCGARVIEKKSLKGKKFYVCENNHYNKENVDENGNEIACPICNFISWKMPTVGQKWDPEEAEQLRIQYENAKKERENNSKASAQVKTKSKVKTKTKAKTKTKKKTTKSKKLKNNKK